MTSDEPTPLEAIGSSELPDKLRQRFACLHARETAHLRGQILETRGSVFPQLVIGLVLMVLGEAGVISASVVLAPVDGPWMWILVAGSLFTGAAVILLVLGGFSLYRWRGYERELVALTKEDDGA